MERLSARLEMLAVVVAEALVSAEVWSLPLMDAAEEALVLRAFSTTGTKYPSEQCVHELVTAQTAMTPDASALEWRGDTMSFAELHTCALQVAAWLVAHGVAPDRVVALQLSRSLEQVVGISAPRPSVAVGAAAFHRGRRGVQLAGGTVSARGGV